MTGNELPHAGRSEDCRHSVIRNLKKVADSVYTRRCAAGPSQRSGSCTRPRRSPSAPRQNPPAPSGVGTAVLHDSPPERAGFERSIPRYRGQRLETTTFERLITFCAVAKAVRNSNLQQRPRTFHKTCRVDRRLPMGPDRDLLGRRARRFFNFFTSADPQREHTRGLAVPRLAFFTLTCSRKNQP